MRCGHVIAAVVLAGVVAVSQAAPSTARVNLVLPSGPEVPANLLRLSIRFARPVEGAVLPRLSLRHAEGTAVAEPFLAQELWSQDGRMLTVLLHPGRVKTGLRARDTMGPILEEGDDVVLALDGRALRRWHVGPLDDSGPMTSAWTLSAVHATTREPLAVALDAPVDGQATNYLAVADVRGRRVAGHASLGDGERRWSFTPDRAWKAGSYRLVVRGTLEDACGNRLGSHFETAAASPPGQPLDAAIPFDVLPGRRSPSR